MRLTLDAARRLQLAALGLNEPPQRPAQKEDLLAAIRRMGLLQIDTISVVARSPYLVLWSRLGHYNPKWLDELLAEGALFEYWAHAVCFLLREDFGYFRRDMLDYASGDRFERHQTPETREAIGRVLAHIHANGEARSAHFERSDGKRGTWWDWKPEKMALEKLYFAGVLMVARREGFQRIYDLHERVRPDWDDARTPPRDECVQTMAFRALRCLGVAQPQWIINYFPDCLRGRISRRALTHLLEEGVREGSVIRAELEGGKESVYLPGDSRLLAEQALDQALPTTQTTFLSPFDPLISDRGRAETLFDFSYRIEVYTPAPKRQYGYFTLPILHRGRLIGRLDPKAHRKEKRFEIRNLHLEPGVALTDAMLDDLATALRDCAEWHGTPEIVLQRSTPTEFASLLQQRL